MSISTITITLNNKKFQLACAEEAQSQLYDLVATLNQKIVEIKNNNPNASYELLLVMAALSLQDQVQSFSKEFSVAKNTNSVSTTSEIMETLNTVASYLENIVKKIEK